MGKMPELFKTAIFLVKKNAEERCDQDEGGKGSNSDFSDDEDINEDDYHFDSDEEDFWEQQYDDNYNSALDSIDEIAEFKNVMERLRVEQNLFCQELLKEVPPEDLAALEEKITKALQKVENVVNNA